MKYAGTRSALSTWERRGEPDNRGEVYRLPVDPRPVHALLRPPTPDSNAGRVKILRMASEARPWERVQSDNPVFLEPRSGQQAACGLNVLVVLPLPFDDDDPDDCPGCAREVGVWSQDPESWWLTRSTRWRAQARRRTEDQNVTDWRARNDQP